MIFGRHANLKYRCGDRLFWARGCYADTAGRNKKQIQEHIGNQLEQDKTADQISIKGFIDPFTGDTQTKTKKYPLRGLKKQCSRQTFSGHL